MLRNVIIVTMTILAEFIHESSEAKYLAIASGIGKAIREGKLLPGQALPTHRELAEQLGVTVGTVTRGYAEAGRRGYVHGETGRGTFVNSHKGGFGSMWEEAQGRVDLGLNTPFHALDPDLSGTLASIATRDDLQILLQYHQSRGMMVHREAGAQWATLHRYPASPENVLVCNGAQHAMLVTMGAMFSPGDRIAVEQLTYPLIKPLAKRLRLQLVPIAMDAGGIIPDALSAACSNETIRGLYTMPGCQNPTLAQISDYRRGEIAEICKRHDIFIIEDDMYALTQETVLPPLSVYAPERSFFIASLSKAVTGGLRVGFICAPSQYVRRIERGIESSVWMTPPLMVEIARQWITDGTAERTLAAKKEEARKRNQIARSIFSDWDFVSTPTGYHIWFPLPGDWRAVEFAETSKEHGVTVAPMEYFAVGHAQHKQAIRISLCGPYDQKILIKGLTILRNILTM